MNAFGNISGRLFTRQNYDKIPDRHTSTTQAALLQRPSSTQFSTQFTNRDVLQRLATRVVVDFPAKARAELIAQIGTPSERLPLTGSPQVNYRTNGNGPTT